MNTVKPSRARSPLSASALGRWARGLLLAGLVQLTTACVPYTTSPTEVGIAVNMVLGMDEKVYPPGGTYFLAPFITDWYTFSTQAQTLTMLADSESGNRPVKDDLEFKTRDGNDVAVDVTVLYRLIPEKAPIVLRTVATNVHELKELIVRPLARSIIRDVLNELTSEDVYAGKKFEAAEKARVQLNATLSAFGLTCDNVILGDHRFHERYQKAINDKKVFEQQVNTHKSAAENIKREWEAKLEATKGEVERMIATENGRAEQAKLEADAFFISKEKEAEALLAEKKANAEGVQKLNEALSGSGGRVMVKRRVAEALKGKRIVLLPGGNGMGLQKLDVNELLRTYGMVDGMKSSPAPAPAPRSTDTPPASSP